MEDKLTKRAVANILGISTRAVERHMSRGRIAFTMERGPTGDQAVFTLSEAHRFRRELEAERPHAAAVVKEAPNSPEQEPRQMARLSDVSLTPVTLGTGDALDTPEMRGRMMAAFEMMASPVRLADKLTLSLTEAALLAGLSRNHLREAIGAGKLKAKIIGRGWKVKRPDLDAYVRKL